MTDIPIVLSRDELIARLISLLPAAKAADKVAPAKHRAAEKAWLIDFHVACRAAAKWDYQRAKLANGRVSTAGLMPRYPLSKAQPIERLIAMVKTSSQPRYTISRRGKWEYLWVLLTADLPTEKGLCE